MNNITLATVGIAGFHCRETRAGGWAVVIRVRGHEVVLHGQMKRLGVGECERHALTEATKALRQLSAPLGTLETTHDVKRALTGDLPKKKAPDLWSTGRQWWRSMGSEAGLRVARRPGDAFSEALRRAEISALTGAEKLRVTRDEDEVAGNVEVREERALARQERQTRRRERDRAKFEREVDVYLEASGGTRRGKSPTPFVPVGDLGDLADLLAALEAEEAN